MKKKEKGQILIVVLIGLVLMGIFIPALVNYIQQEARWTVKERKSSLAFHLAESGIDRGIWKIKESTSTWAAVAVNGTAIPNYSFDKTYRDVEGGVYRIRFSSGPDTNEATIIAEGKDASSQEVRAIRCVVQNQAFPGAMLTGGAITYSNAFDIHWGAIMAQGNIDIQTGVAAQDYYPRKYSAQVVTCNSKGYERDTTGLNPPNTDGIEWWSDYPVPDLPVLDFVSLRKSAEDSGTLNIYGCNYKSGKKTIYNAPWTSNLCSGIKSAVYSHDKHFLNPWKHGSALKNYVWYWDGDVELIGGTGSSGSGIYGTVIIRGNCVLNVGDNYSFTGPIPKNAWREYGKISKTTGDTKATDEYPGDAGLQAVDATYSFGSSGSGWSNALGSYGGTNTDVGIRGLLYVGGDLLIEGVLDINGVVWVVGNVTKGTGNTDRCIIFYSEQISVPSLNVVLTRKSWEEIPPSSTAWVN
ncbi:MAG: hypothetical protein JW803_05515 [Endomicrobiales bacterium]|nr:hypothetical protein [Endomicrobiales bacterium]